MEYYMKSTIKHVFLIIDSDYEDISRIFNGKEEPTNAFKAFCQFVFCNLLGFVKCFDSSLPDDDPNNYYMEREWRVAGNVSFTLKDIHRVIFPRAYAERFRIDVPEYVGQIHFADAD